MNTKQEAVNQKPPRTDKAVNLTSLKNLEKFLLLLNSTIPKLLIYFQESDCKETKLTTHVLINQMTTDTASQFRELRYRELQATLQFYRKTEANSPLKEFANAFLALMTKANVLAIQTLSAKIKNARNALQNEIIILEPKNSSNNNNNMGSEQNANQTQVLPVSNNLHKDLQQKSPNKQEDVVVYVETKKITAHTKLKPLFDEIDKVIDRLEKGSLHFFSRGMGAKAKAIKEAFQIAKRHINQPEYAHLEYTALCHAFLKIHATARRSLYSELNDHRKSPSKGKGQNSLFFNRQARALTDILDFIGPEPTEQTTLLP